MSMLFFTPLFLMTMKKFFLYLIILTLLTSVTSLTGITSLPSLAAPFPDTPSDAWFTPYVQELVDQGIVQGYPNGKFGSWDPVNRAELSKIIVNLEKSLQQKLTKQTEAVSWWEDHSFEIILLAITILGWLNVLKMVKRSVATKESNEPQEPREPKSPLPHELNELDSPNNPQNPNVPKPPPNWWM